MEATKNCLLFPNEPTFGELFLEAEMGGPGPCKELKSRIELLVQGMYEEGAEEPNVFDYWLLEKDMSTDESDFAVTLDLDVVEVADGEEKKQQKNFEEYLERIRFRLVYENDGEIEKMRYDFSFDGLLEAVKEFNRLVA